LTRRRALIIVLGLLGAVLALGAGATLLLVTLDWRPYIERAASRSLGRPISVASLRIGWRNPLAVELTDLRLANAAWGSQPDMLRIEKVVATIDVSSLLHGAVRYQALHLENPVLLLERDSNGIGNWHLEANPGAPGLAVIPGNLVYDFVPRVGWDKGMAARWIARRARAELGGPPAVLYAGDDTTDEAAFRRLRRSAVTIRVGGGSTAAEFALRSVADVHALLGWLARALG